MMAFKANALMGRPKRTPGRPPAKTITRPTTLSECAQLLKQQGAAVAVLAVQDLQAYWLSIMSDSKASNKDKLTASKLYADSVGAFDKQQDNNRAPAVYTWGKVEEQPPEDAEIIPQKECSEEQT